MRPHPCSHTWLSSWMDYAHVHTRDWISALQHGGVRIRKGLCLWKGNLLYCQIQQLYRKVYWLKKHSNVSETLTALIQVPYFNAHLSYIELSKTKFPSWEVLTAKASDLGLDFQKATPPEDLTLQDGFYGRQNFQPILTPSASKSDVSSQGLAVHVDAEGIFWR